MPNHQSDIVSLKDYLDEKSDFYNQPSFIQTDPVSVPHQFSKKEDIEIAGFLTALISWGRRDMIIKSANRIMDLMGRSPADFILHAEINDLKRLSTFVYRTFNGDDLLFLVYALRNIYSDQGGLEKLAYKGFVETGSVKGSIMSVRSAILETTHLKRSEKHLANPDKGSAAKRINMFLRWMVRQDENGVDFGIWKKIPQSELVCPLDVHSGRVARTLGLLSRKQDDWKAVEELTTNLRKLNPADPVQYDYALFGIGVFEDNMNR